MFEVGQKILSKKFHTCGANSWVIVRTGADFKLKCDRCGRIIMLSSDKLKRIIKEVKNDTV